MKKKGQDTPMLSASVRQITGIILLAAGWGWAGGNYIPQGSDLWVYVTHMIPFLILLVLCFGFLCVPDVPQRTRSMRGLATIGLNIFAAGSCVVLPVGVLLDVINPDPTSYGIRTVADWVPIVILLLGALVWLTTLIHARQSHAETVIASNKVASEKYEKGMRGQLHVPGEGQ